MQGWLPVPNPVAFTVFGLDIMWYGICVTTAIVVAFYLLYKLAPSRELNQEHVLDIALCGVPMGIIGARLYYVVFSWANYKDDLMEIFNVRGGGLAIHGGIIFGFGTAILLLTKWKESILDWLDLLFVCLPLGQAIGRWGNYFNSEAHGGPTDLPWAIYADGEWVHPTFLYESLWCFLLFIFMMWWAKTKPAKKGQLVCIYLIFYSVERFFVEGLRTDSLYIGSFRQAQVISAVLFLCGVVGLVIIAKRKDKTSEEAS